jgi:ATP-binding cassette subfamily B protein
VQATASAPTQATTEFSVQRDWHSDRRSPARWVFSHVWRYKIFLIGILIGALGNAAGGALMPILIGMSFNAVIATPPDLNALGVAAVLIVVSQLARAALQFMRNFSAEVIGQRIERDTRDEL